MALAPRLEFHREMGIATAPAIHPPTDERLLILDVSDLLNFLGVHGLVTGIQRVQLELAKAVLAQPGRRAGFDRIVFCFTELGWSWLLADESLRSVIAYAESDAVDPAEAGALAERVRVRAAPCAPAAGSAFVNLGGFWGGGALRGERERLRAMGVKFGVMTHDIFAITLPEMCEPGVVASFDASFRAGLASWDFIIANSQFTASDVGGFMDRIGVQPIPVAAAPLAHSLGAPADGPADLPPALAGLPFVLCVGTIEPRKNHQTLVEAWKRLAAKHPDLPRLALSGGLAGGPTPWPAASPPARPPRGRWSGYRTSPTASSTPSIAAACSPSSPR
jgi:glycosyltransferase involved in cell wall biosynthesis